MPLHDWSAMKGWEGVYVLWMTELLRNIKSELPAGFRAYLASGLAVASGPPSSRQDVSVLGHLDPGFGEYVGDESGPNSCAEENPDIEVAIATLEPEPSLLIERDGRLVAAVELISPRNKDRESARTNYGRRYAGYLMDGVNLLLIDVLPRPLRFSFANFIAGELEIPNQPDLPAPIAISYRVGEPAAQGGRFLAIWRYQLKPAEPLPNVVLPLDVHRSVRVDLEGTYMRAAKDAYLD